jgi:hypothetical protein
LPFYWSATKWRELPLAGQPSISGHFFLVISLLLLRLYGRQGVSDENFDGWKKCSSDAVLLES